MNYFRILKFIKFRLGIFQDIKQKIAKILCPNNGDELEMHQDLKYFASLFWCLFKKLFDVYRYRRSEICSVYVYGDRSAQLLLKNYSDVV